MGVSFSEAAVGELSWAEGTNSGQDEMKCLKNFLQMTFSPGSQTPNQGFTCK